MTEAIEVTIDALGAQGDGIAALEGKRLFVPGTVPGDRVRVAIAGARGGGFSGQVIEIIAPGPGRAPPPCPHFGECGGCALQHLAPESYAAWKRERLLAALRQHGLATDMVRPLLSVPPGTRRRLRLAAVRTRKGVVLGLQSRRSLRVVDLGSCEVAHPDLVRLFAPVRELLAATIAVGNGADVALTRAESGVELVLIGGGELALPTRERLAAFAEAQDLARLSWAAAEGDPIDPILQRRPVRMMWSGVPVELAPEAFIQPTEVGEALLVAETMAGIAGVDRLADLYAGSGPFSLAAVQKGKARVAAFEGDAAAVAALKSAADRSGLSGRLTATVRDLARRPLADEELEGLDAVILDPPRVGARSQAEALAASPVPCIVMVSCNPATFARDARVLVEGGYRIDRIQPVDQFLWSPHLEVAATLRRP